jgi:hypothetical protein
LEFAVGDEREEGAVLVGDNVVGEAVDGAEVVGNEVVGEAVVGDFVVGAKVVGDTVVGEEVVGDFVVGANVGGAAVVGDDVVGDCVGHAFLAEAFQSSELPSNEFGSDLKIISQYNIHIRKSIFTKTIISRVHKMHKKKVH